MSKKAALFISILFLSTSIVYGYSFENIRDGCVYIRGGNDQIVNVSYEPVYQIETHKDFIYFQF